jgi:Protein of unknown function (DUF4197)
LKKILLSAILITCFTACDTAQQLINQAATAYQQGGAVGLSSEEIANGLKEALTVGTQNGTGRLSSIDGFFANAALKILMPPEVVKVENTLRDFGMGSVVDKAVLSMNRAAEDAAKSAAPIFVSAIKQMTITDAVNILKGGNNAATNYFKDKTTAALTAAFRPSVEKSLSKVNATKYWKDVFSTYNRFSSNPVNTDLTAYVTNKAIAGIFTEVASEELKIRQNPEARVSDLLKKVFGSAMAQGK